MSPVLALAAILVVTAAIVAVTARRPALVAGSAAVLLAAAPLLADPLPPALPFLERGVGAVLAGEFLWLGLRGRPMSGASALGWPSLGLLAVAAFAAGVGAQPLVPGAEPAAALGAALALLTIAVVAVTGRADGVQLGLSALVLVVAATLVRLALAGTASALETLLDAGIGVAVAGATVLLVPRIADDARPAAAAAVSAGSTADDDWSAGADSGVDGGMGGSGAPTRRRSIAASDLRKAPAPDSGARSGRRIPDPAPTTDLRASLERWHLADDDLARDVGDPADTGPNPTPENRATDPDDVEDPANPSSHDPRPDASGPTNRPRTNDRR